MMLADMCEWMWQYTFTRPALRNWCDLVWPRGYEPRSNVPLRDNENTSWKNGSPLGKSTVDPRVIATTRGWNVSPSCRMRAPRSGNGDAFGASWMKTMTLDSSDSGLGGALSTRRGAYAADGGAVETGTVIMT